MIEPASPQPKTRRHNAPEANIQSQAFIWFWNAYPKFRLCLFAVTNQNERSGYENARMQAISGARRKMMGVVAGVSDLVGLIPNSQWHGFCAECKTKTGRQEEAQKAWQAKITEMGYYYFVFRSLEQFKDEVRDYLATYAENSIQGK